MDKNQASSKPPPQSAPSSLSLLSQAFHMACSVCFACANSLAAPKKSSNSPSVPVAVSSHKNPSSRIGFSPISSSRSLRPLRAQNAESNQSTTKINSILCPECDGNGAKLCTQCEGTGVNTKDHFNGQFKAGGLCWLCRGKREILCGNCNGAGFMGGFMSTFDE